MTEKKLDEILFVVKGIEAKLLGLLKPGSQEKVIKELAKNGTTVVESITGIIRLITDKAIQIVVGVKGSWIPKSAIENLDKIALAQGEEATIKIKAWFTEKVKWAVI